MRKILFSAAFAMSSVIAAAQNDEPQPSDDQLQQLAPRETQVTNERAAKVDAVRNQSQSEVESEKEAKDKGQSQKQTKNQPVGLNPPDQTAKPVAHPRIEKKNKIISE